MPSVGSRIKNRRMEIGLSVDELANMIGKNRATIYRYENDDIGDIPLSVIEPLATALRTTPSYIMGWTDKPEALQKPLDDDKWVEIKNPDIRMIARGGKKMTPEQSETARKILEVAFPDVFNDK